MSIISTIAALKVGDSVQINDWNEKMTVCGVSEHYVLVHDGPLYTIIQRFPNELEYNGIPLGAAVCGPDNWVFGVQLPGYEDEKEDYYHFENPEWCTAYLHSLEQGETEISMRRRAQITQISVVGRAECEKG